MTVFHNLFLYLFTFILLLSCTPCTHFFLPQTASLPAVLFSLSSSSTSLFFSTSFLPLLHPLLLHHHPFPPSFSLSLCLQGKVAQTACMSACKHLSTSLMQMLLDTELKQISMGAIQQFNLDVIQCECKLK